MLSKVLFTFLQQIIWPNRTCWASVHLWRWWWWVGMVLRCHIKTHRPRLRLLHHFGISVHSNCVTKSLLWRKLKRNLLNISIFFEMKVAIVSLASEWIHVHLYSDFQFLFSWIRRWFFSCPDVWTARLIGGHQVRVLSPQFMQSKFDDAVRFFDW